MAILEGYPVPRWLAEALAVSSVCGAATAPVLWLQFHAVPVLAVPANALAAPAMAPLLSLALLAALVDPVSPTVATSLVGLAGWCAAWLALCARLVGGLPFAQVTSTRGALACSRAASSLRPMLGGNGGAQAGLPHLGHRPAEDPCSGRAPSQPLRGGRGRGARRGRARRRRCGGGLQLLGLFGGEQRLVIVEDVDEWKAPEAKIIAAYVKNPAPETTLALVATEIKKDSRSRKACAKSGDVLLYDAPRRRHLPSWVARQFEQLGSSADRDACRLLVEMVGEDPDRLRSEIEKLATWSDGEPVTEADVRLLASVSAETSVFVLTDAWGRRDVAAALGAVESLLERSGPRELPRLVALLANHVGRVRACQVLAAEGVSPRDAAPKLKMHPFAAEKAFAHAGKYEPDELAAATVRLARLDLALKGASRLTGELEFERALVDVTKASR
jgi:DNA polymerase III delta subunit